METKEKIAPIATIMHKHPVWVVSLSLNPSSALLFRRAGPKNPAKISPNIANSIVPKAEGSSSSYILWPGLSAYDVKLYINIKKRSEIFLISS